MTKSNLGIHHITAIVGDPQENLSFYGDVLGLRLVKKTVNFDDPGTFHLYFGNEGGEPGTIITFFPWKDASPGRIGTGQVGITSYAIPVGAMGFWKNRLDEFQIPYKLITKFKETILSFHDPHGLKLELVETCEGDASNWMVDDVSPNHAIKGFRGATLYSESADKSEKMLVDVMGLEQIGEENGITRFKSNADIGNVVDVDSTIISEGKIGIGTVHHLSWRAKDDKDQLEWRQWVQQKGYTPTNVLDRNYFTSIYFREDGGILFEIATDPPGFAIDETFESLGEHLKLPSWLEQHRTQIETILPSIQVKGGKLK